MAGVIDHLEKSNRDNNNIKIIIIILHPLNT